MSTQLRQTSLQFGSPSASDTTEIIVHKCYLAEVEEKEGGTARLLIIELTASITEMWASSCLYMTENGSGEVSTEYGVGMSGSHTLF